MCGLYSMTRPAEAVIHYFDLADVPIIEPRFKVSPGTQCVVVHQEQSDRKANLMKWGFRPPSAKKSFAPINVKSETMFSNNFWKHSALLRRCIIVADGFFEPEGPKRPGRPQHFFQSGTFIPLAAIWTTSKDADGSPYKSFAIATCNPSSVVGRIHDRSPVMLNKEEFDLWLDPQNDDEELVRPVLEPKDPKLFSHRVSDSLYKLRPDDPKCIAQLERKSDQTIVPVVGESCPSCGANLETDGTNKWCVDKSRCDWGNEDEWSLLTDATRNDEQ